MITLKLNNTGDNFVFLDHISDIEAIGQIEAEDLYTNALRGYIVRPVTALRLDSQADTSLRDIMSVQFSGAIRVNKIMFLLENTKWNVIISDGSYEYLMNEIRLFKLDTPFPKKISI